ncbi:MAG: hypothetical protein Q7S71_02500 [Candidatus Nitrotoga sp.]|nr:hypothetical protein [Candidatus Nitrotoga sp.]
MSMNEADTCYHLIDPVLREKGYVSRERITLETILTPAPVGDHRQYRGAGAHRCRCAGTVERADGGSGLRPGVVNQLG